MAKVKADYPLKIGLLLVAIAWFLFTVYQFIKGSLHGASADWPFWIVLTDTTGIIGLAFRTAGSFMAVIAVLFYILKRDLSGPEATMTFRWILVAEVVYWLALLPSGVWGILPASGDFIAADFGLRFLIETGIPCLVESLVAPIVLVKLFFELKPKESKGAIKWGLISGTVYVFVFWLDNTCNWIVAIMEKGIEYVSLYPVNLLSFGLTSVGLLLLTLYTAYFSRKSIGTKKLNKLNWRKIGAIILGLGLYFDVIYVLWLFFGSVGGWGTWYAWFLGHNMNLWVLALPLVGLPLLFNGKRKRKPPKKPMESPKEPAQTPKKAAKKPAKTPKS